MCIAYIRFQPEQDTALFIAANRDEFHARPSAFASIWDDSPNLIAGRDLEAGGTWLGLNRQGGTALITNIRDPHSMRSNTKSRGALVRNALLHHAQQDGFESVALNQFIKDQGPLEDYNGFNLIFGDTKKLYYLNNYQQSAECHPYELHAGSYTLSNADLFTVWPKTRELGLSLDGVNLEAIDSDVFAALESTTVRDFCEAIFDKLANNQQAPDHLLPKTGISDGMEKLLSSPFIVSPDYGTRCSSIILSFKDGSSFMAERSFNPKGQAVQQTMFYTQDGAVYSTSTK